MRDTRKEISRFRELSDLMFGPKTKKERLAQLQAQVEKMKQHGIPQELAKDLLLHGVWLTNDQMHNWLLKEWEIKNK